jgi:NADH:quinone reductase (non-electrogenic)
LKKFITYIQIPKMMLRMVQKRALQLRANANKRESSALFDSSRKKERLVILGSGWASFKILKDLSVHSARFDIKVISPRNYFLFTPLLTSSCVGTLSFRSIIEPVRNMSESSRYYQASALDVDIGTKSVRCMGKLTGEEFSVNYDKLVVGVGARNNTFGIDGVEEHAMFLKDLSDARRIRNKIIECFELANLPTLSGEERRKVLTFAVVGGGPTGCELIAELSDFLWEDLLRAFPNVSAGDVRIVLLEGSDGILSQFEWRLAKQAMNNFKRAGIDVRLGTAVTRVERDSVLLASGERLHTGMVVWSTGVAPTPLVRAFEGRFAEQNGRLFVDAHLRVRDADTMRPLPDVYALGDCAVIDGDPLPPTAQVAQQQGTYLSRQLLSLTPVAEQKPFQFHYLGMMAYIGGFKALLDSPYLVGSGWLEWLAWRGTYFSKLGSWKNKMNVPADWLRTLIFGRDISSF